jgi:hypothetical protein
MNPNIHQQENLASYPQINTLIFQLLSVAQAGGMTERRAEKIYEEIHGHFINMQGETFWPLRDDLMRILVTPDASFAACDEGDIRSPNRWN